NDENNGFVAGLLWAQFHRLTLHGQFMVDDFDSRGESDETLSFTLVGSLLYAAPTFDLGFTLEMVSARTYNAPQPEGRYMYLLRGLATQFNDYIHASLFADLYLDGVVPGLRVTPRLHLLAQGERDFHLPFPPKGTEMNLILNGTVARTLRPAVQVHFQRVPWWWIRFDGGVNVTSNTGNVKDQTTTRFVGELEFGLRLSLEDAFRLTL
ncbi:MAG: hypothetical protein ACE5G0_23235, partial [Rhodothermales bacterium]